MYILGIGDALSDAFRTLLLTLCNVVYSLIVFFFTIFNEMGTARLDINVDIIFQRIGFILGLFMVFRLTFSAITYLIEPDKITDNQKGIGNIIKKVLIVIILLGTTQYLFKEAYDLQDKLIDSHVIEKILLPGFATNEIEGNNGANIAWYVFSQFYTYNESISNSDSDCSNAIELTEDGFKDSDETTLKGAYRCLNERERGFLDFFKEHDEEDYYINFNGILALLVGGVLVWVIITYTFQVGVRVIQLAYLEIIAPIPIMMYLMPSGEDKLKKWGQQCLTTFLDFFIRLAIMDFAILIIMSLINSDNSTFLEDFSASGIIQNGYIIVVMIVATLIFAKKVPNLLKEIFPSMGGAAGFSYGIGIPKETKGLATFGLGAAAGSLAGMASGILNGYGVKGKIAGAFGGFNRGLVGGAKTKGNIIKNVQGGMSSARQARQRALDKQMYKIDNAKITKEYQDNEAIIAAKKAIDDRAESQLLKTDAGAQAAQARLNYIESNVGNRDVSTGQIITTADVVKQKAAYKTYMDGAKATWVNANSRTDAEIAKQMQAIQNKTGTSINNYSDADTAASTAKTNNARAARTVTENEAEKQKIQEKKSKIK